MSPCTVWILIALGLVPITSWSVRLDPFQVEQAIEIPAGTFLGCAVVCGAPAVSYVEEAEAPRTLTRLYVTRDGFNLEALRDWPAITHRCALALPRPAQETSADVCAAEIVHVWEGGR